MNLDLLTLARDVARNGSECDSPAEDLARRVWDLLETPHPCGWPKIEVVYAPLNPSQPVGVRWESLGGGVQDPDEMIALGVGLIAAGLKAKEPRR